jgi:hypothetical protein
MPIHEFDPRHEPVHDPIIRRCLQCTNTVLYERDWIGRVSKRERESESWAIPLDIDNACCQRATNAPDPPTTIYKSRLDTKMRETETETERQRDRDRDRETETETETELEVSNNNRTSRITESNTVSKYQP